MQEAGRDGMPAATASTAQPARLALPYPGAFLLSGLQVLSVEQLLNQA